MDLSYATSNDTLDLLQVWVDDDGDVTVTVTESGGDGHSHVFPVDRAVVLAALLIPARA